MKENISGKRVINNQKVGKVTEEFSGNNITQFGGAGLIRRFIERKYYKYLTLFEGCFTAKCVEVAEKKLKIGTRMTRI